MEYTLPVPPPNLNLRPEEEVFTYRNRWWSWGDSTPRPPACKNSCHTVSGSLSVSVDESTAFLRHLPLYHNFSPGWYKNWYSKSISTSYLSELAISTYKAKVVVPATNATLLTGQLDRTPPSLLYCGALGLAPKNGIIMTSAQHLRQLPNGK